ncbi:hypothetical protein MCELHM10_01153 [Paracoccaceae bacterium]
MRNPLVLVLAIGLLCLAKPASAFSDCMAEGYLDGFAEAPTAGELTCVEFFRFAVNTPDGPREVRGIADAAVDWAAPPALVAEVERGARLAGNTFSLLGRFSVDDITILILDDVYATEEITNHGTGEQVLGIALSDRAPDPDRPAECLITIYALATPATDGSMATTVAHEIFHCVQGATYPGPKYQSYGEGGAWWIEGAAEAFAAAAIPESAAYTDRSADFDTSVEMRYALDRMLHQSVHFFYWLMQDRGGLSALMPFQDAMADSGGRDAQHAAMRRALPPDAWQAFAEAYADSRIFHPQGSGLSSSPPEGTVMTFEATGRETLPLEPFALSLGQATYGCGVWANTVAPDAPAMTWKPEDASASDAWRALLPEIDTREGRDTVWSFVTMPVDDSLVEGEVEVERRHSCTPCLGIDRVDACLIGTWEQSGGGPAEWMEAQGFPGNPEVVGDPQMTLRADGVFATHGFGVRISDVNDDDVISGRGSVFGAFGAWSAADGKLNMCATAGGGMSGTTTVTTEDGSGSFGSGRGGGGEFSVSYGCSATDLSTSLQMHGFPDMVTTYRKVGE